MTKLCSVLILTLASVAVMAGQTNNEWIRYESSEGRYSVSLPREPKASSQESTASTGEKLPQYLATTIEGNGAFLVGYFDYTPQMTFSLDKARDGMLNSMNATSLAEEMISLSGAPGRAVKLLAKASDGQEFIDRARLYDVAKRVYILQCIFPKTEESPTVIEKCDKFFDSFKVSTRQ